jgi:hypothetical protein
VGILEEIDKVSHCLSQDDRLHSSHVSLYLALLVIWHQSSLANPFIINRKKLMSISKIGSFATYHKCMKQLEEFGYIKYAPTFNSFIGTRVQLLVITK